MKVLLEGLETDFEACTAMMDDDLREEVHMEKAPCSDQEFLDAYVKLHSEKFFGEQFTV